MDWNPSSSLGDSQGTIEPRKKKLITFHSTGWLIGILIMVCLNPYIIGWYNPLYNPINQRFFIAQLRVLLTYVYPCYLAGVLNKFLGDEKNRKYPRNKKGVFVGISHYGVCWDWGTSNDPLIFEGKLNLFQRAHVSTIPKRSLNAALRLSSL